MAETSRHDAWQAGDRYDAYMGRWSRQIALDVACGTGALSAAIVARCNPRSLLSIDPSEGFIATAREKVLDRRITFQVGDAQALAVETASREVVASALMLNFVPDKAKALAEMKRVARPAGTVGFYVWDYPGGGVSKCARSGMPQRPSTPPRGTLPRTGVFRFAHRMV